jgi:hypothetical protein
MAGSITWRAYAPDSALPTAEYALKIDKTNAAATTTTGSYILMPIRTSASTQILPSWIKKRYVLAHSTSNPKIKRKFYVGNLTALTSILGGSTISTEDYPGADDVAGTNTTWTVTAFRGEKRNIPPAYTSGDTGLTDTGA